MIEDARRMTGNADGLDAWSRSAAFLVRQALEALVVEAIERRHGKIARPSFASQLIVVRTLIPEQLAKEVAWTWSALSSATHAHSYGLPATSGELTRWLEVVERLAQELEVNSVAVPQVAGPDQRESAASEREIAAP